MKKPVIDYREFRLSKLRQPQFSHLLLLIAWPIYISLYFFLEQVSPLDECLTVHCALDDMIPFCEVFVIPYVCWFPLLAFTVLYFMFYDIENFKGFHVYLIVLDVIALTIYSIIPTKVDFQPEVLPNNIFGGIVRFLYAADMNNNACPSMHVAFSIAVGSCWSKRSQTSIWVKLLIWGIAAMICLSTVFIKQHSVLDFFGALPLCLVAEWAAYGKRYWIPKFKSKFAKA